MVSVFSLTDFIGKSVFAGFAFENVSDKAIGNKLFFERFRHVGDLLKRESNNGGNRVLCLLHGKISLLSKS